MVPKLWRINKALCKQLDKFKLELARHYFMNVIQVNNSVLLKLSTPILTPLPILEAWGQSLHPQLQSILGKV
jgi:hypothetical protein